VDPLRSIYDEDPEMCELVRVFALELPGRAEELERHVASGNLERLHVLAHQLKGAGGGYGYDEISALAGALENAILAHCDEDEIEARTRALCGLLRAIIPPEA
jgi:histidine phosphotransfer protein HptB